MKCDEKQTRSNRWPFPPLNCRPSAVFFYKRLELVFQCAAHLIQRLFTNCLTTQRLKLQSISGYFRSLFEKGNVSQTVKYQSMYGQRNLQSFLLKDLFQKKIETEMNARFQNIFSRWPTFCVVVHVRSLESHALEFVTQKEGNKAHCLNLWPYSLSKTELYISHSTVYIPKKVPVMRPQMFFLHHHLAQTTSKK